MTEKRAYHLADEDPQFAQRSKDIFGDLDKIQNNLALNKHDIKPVAAKRKTQDHTLLDTDKKAKAGKPAFESNPEKWTKYDLSDTSDTNDRQNTQAAFAFLYDMQKRRKSEEKATDTESEARDVDMKEEIHEDSKRIAFQKPSAFKMQEHVVGMVAVSKKKLVSGDQRKDVCDKVDLDHLENISAAEFQAEIAGKLEDSCGLKPPIESAEKSSAFKHVSKTKRNMRTRKSSDNDED